MHPLQFDAVLDARRMQPRHEAVNHRRARDAAAVDPRPSRALVRRGLAALLTAIGALLLRQGARLHSSPPPTPLPVRRVTTRP